MDREVAETAGHITVTMSAGMVSGSLLRVGETALGTSGSSVGKGVAVLNLSIVTTNKYSYITL